MHSNLIDFPYLIHLNKDPVNFRIGTAQQAKSSAFIAETE